MNRAVYQKMTKAQLVDLLVRRDRTGAQQTAKLIREVAIATTHTSARLQKAFAVMTGKAATAHLDFARKKSKAEYQARLKNGHRDKAGTYAGVILERMKLNPANYELEHQTMPTKSQVTGWIKETAPAELRTKGRPKERPKKVNSRKMRYGPSRI